MPSARDPQSRKVIVLCEQDTVIEKDSVRTHGVLSFGP